MKNKIQRLTLILQLLLGGSLAQGATSYWDSNGTDPGSGTTPTGTWDTDSFWSSDASGSSATSVWSDGDFAVFSAGNDATNAYAVTIAGNVHPAGLRFTNSAATITGGTLTFTNDLEFPIEVYGTATINSDLQDTSGTAGFRKTGPGRLRLGGAGSFYGGTSVVAEGIVSVTSASALGSSLAPTIVSNNASLEITNATALAEPVILNGYGISNRGALYGYIGTTGKLSPWTGGAVINSNTRINHYGTTGNWWYWSTRSIETNGLTDADVYIGGTGNSLRLDINNGKPAIDVGNGAIYKDGTVELRLEVATRARAFYFNQGHLLTRVGTGVDFVNRIVSPGVYAPAPIYVGPDAGQFRNGSGGPSQSWAHSIILSAGANPTFRTYAGYSITLNGPISGDGGISKFADTGILTLNGTNTYLGATSIKGGTVVLGANGSISNSTLIDVQGGATLDVSAVSGGFVLGPAQTLQGAGTVSGSVVANGRLAPGPAVATLTFANNLAIGGGLQFKLNKTNSITSDQINVLGALNNTGAGTVTITNIGPALTAGDTFHLFSQPVINGGALQIHSADNVVWTNNLAVDGTITALFVPAAPAANLAIQPATPGTFRVTATGTANSAYSLLTSTNVSTPLTNWSRIAVTNADPNGNIEFFDNAATGQHRFYRIAN